MSWLFGRVETDDEIADPEMERLRGFSDHELRGLSDIGVLMVGVSVLLDERTADKALVAELRRRLR